MARMPQLRKIAKDFELKLISIEDLVSYRMKHDMIGTWFASLMLATKPNKVSKSSEKQVN
jgi:hypothetical protein